MTDGPTDRQTDGPTKLLIEAPFPELKNTMGELVLIKHVFVMNLFQATQVYEMVYQSRAKSFVVF